MHIYKGDNVGDFGDGVRIDDNDRNDNTKKNKKKKNNGVSNSLLTYRRSKEINSSDGHINFDDNNEDNDEDPVQNNRNTIISNLTPFPKKRKYISSSTLTLNKRVHRTVHPIPPRGGSREAGGGVLLGDDMNGASTSSASARATSSASGGPGLGLGFGSGSSSSSTYVRASGSSSSMDKATASKINKPIKNPSNTDAFDELEQELVGNTMSYAGNNINVNHSVHTSHTSNEFDEFEQELLGNTTNSTNKSTYDSTNIVDDTGTDINNENNVTANINNKSINTNLNTISNLDDLERELLGDTVHNNNSTHDSTNNSTYDSTNNTYDSTNIIGDISTDISNENDKASATSSVALDDLMRLLNS
jgi:hypothetical protein